MGSVADKIAKRMASARGSKVVDMAGWREGRKLALEAGFGSEGDATLLREVGTRETVSCTVPAGYAGGEGEIWFVRVLPPPHELCSRHIVFTTPYVIRDYPESAYAGHLHEAIFLTGIPDIRESLPHA